MSPTLQSDMQNTNDCAIIERLKGDVMQWVVKDGEGFFLNNRQQVDTEAEAEIYDRFEDAVEEAFWLDVKFDTDDWFTVERVTNAPA